MSEEEDSARMQYKEERNDLPHLGCQTEGGGATPTSGGNRDKEGDEMTAGISTHTTNKNEPDEVCKSEKYRWASTSLPSLGGLANSQGESARGAHAERTRSAREENNPLRELQKRTEICVETEGRETYAK